MKQSLILLPVMLFFMTKLAGQTQSVGIKFGLSNYQGDLVKQHININESRAAAGFFVRRNLSDHFVIRAVFEYASIGGSDANYTDRAGRNLSFTNHLFATSLNGQYNFFGKPRVDRNGEFFQHLSPMATFGIGAVVYNPKTRGYDLDAREMAHNGKQYGFFLPVGGGLEYELTPKTTIGIEAVTNLAFTDMLDGVSESGRMYNHDWFGSATFTVQYWLDSPKKVKKRAEKPLVSW